MKSISTYPFSLAYHGPPIFHDAYLGWGDWHIGSKLGSQNYNPSTKGMHLVSGSHDYPVSQIAVTQSLLEFSHAGGQIGVYNNWPTNSHADLVYTLQFAEPLNQPDSDGDGLSDALEIGGWRDGTGKVHYTNATNPDSDGDGLSDGFEAGPLMRSALDGSKYFKLVSDPNDTDSDSDGLNDYMEVGDLETNPLNEDTDGDGLPDVMEWNAGTDPHIKDTDGDGISDYEEYWNKYVDPKVIDVLPWKDNEVTRELYLGMAKGDWANEGHDNIYYQIGQFISQLVCVGSIRDSPIDASHGDNFDAALNAIGAVPSGALETNLAKFIGTHTGVSAKFIAVVDKGKINREIMVAKHGEPLVQLMESRGISVVNLGEKGVDVTKVDNLYTKSYPGSWTVGMEINAEENLNKHFFEKGTGVGANTNEQLCIWPQILSTGGIVMLNCCMRVANSSYSSHQRGCLLREQKRVKLPHSLSAIQTK